MAGNNFTMINDMTFYTVLVWLLIIPVMLCEPYPQHLTWLSWKIRVIQNHEMKGPMMGHIIQSDNKYKEDKTTRE